MKIRYKFVNEVVEVEVDEKWGKILMELDRLERNNDKKETRRHLFLDTGMDCSEWIADEADPETVITELIDDRRLLEDIRSALSEKQKDLFDTVYVEGFAPFEYARANNVSKASISKRMKVIKKKMKKISGNG